MTMKTMSRAAKNFAATNGRVPVGKAVAAPAAVVEPVIETATGPAPEPVAPPPPTKRARFVRERVASVPAAVAVPLPQRSAKAAGKMMSRNLVLGPKDGRTGKPDEKRTGPIK